MRIGWLFLPAPGERWLIVYKVGKTRDESDWYTVTSGEVIEVNVGGQWVRTRIEHNGKGYYAVVPGVNLANELKARLPE